METPFMDVFQIVGDGRFQFQIPLTEFSSFYASRDIAICRFFLLERKYIYISEHRKEYAFMQEYLNLGHILVISLIILLHPSFLCFKTRWFYY